MGVVAATTQNIKLEGEINFEYIIGMTGENPITLSSTDYAYNSNVIRECGALQKRVS